MLVLTRKNKEAIQIGEEIEVKILGIEGDQVKLGIEAPKSIDIHRKEIYLDIKNQNNEALDVSTDLLALLNQENKK